MNVCVFQQKNLSSIIAYFGKTMDTALHHDYTLITVYMARRGCRSPRRWTYQRMQRYHDNVEPWSCSTFGGANTCTSNDVLSHGILMHVKSEEEGVGVGEAGV